MATHFGLDRGPRQLQPEIDPKSLLRLRQVLRLVPVSASTWWNGVRDCRFPKPFKLGPNTTVWRAADIICLIESLTNDGRLGVAASKAGRNR